MIIDEQDRLNLIKYRLEEADEAIVDVELSIQNERFRTAVNRIYYGCFYSLMALGLLHHYDSSKHNKLIGWFNKTFVHEGDVDPKYSAIINELYKCRTQNDYESYVDFDKETVLKMFEQMKEFIAEIKRILNN